MNKTKKQLLSEVKRLRHRLEQNELTSAAAAWPLFVMEYRRQSSR